MPRNVRNFWIVVNVDGRERLVEAGPKAKDGGFKVTVYQREKGDVSRKTVEIIGRATNDGHLVTTTSVNEEREAVSSVIELTTER